MSLRDISAIVFCFAFPLAVGLSAPLIRQYLVNSDGQDSGNYGPGYDVVITCADGICVVEGVNGNGDAGWQLVKAQIQVIVNREVVSTEWFVGRLPICDVCDVDGDRDVDLSDVADCLRRLTGPT